METAQPEIEQSPYLIDGTNVCFWQRLSDGGKDEAPSLIVLLTLVTELSARRKAFLCVFDTGTQHRLRPSDQEVYQQLLESYSDLFIEVSGGASADEFLLERAHKLQSAIISTDRFGNQDRRQYPWLRDSGRLISGNVIANYLQIPALDINILLQKDIESLRRDFERAYQSSLSESTAGLAPVATYSPISDAYDRILNFARRFGEPHVTLAMHAALPLGLTPELLHLIRTNFVSRAPMIAEADLLLSPLCHEVGGELYEMYPEVRELLLAELNEDEELGEERVKELAEFLMVYAARNFNSTHHSELRNFLVAQQWTALAHLRPAEAAQMLASALGKRLSAQNPVGSVRLAQLATTFKTQLMGQDNVLTYAAGIERLAFGDVERASELFGILGAGEQSPAIKSVPLPALPELAKLWPDAATVGEGAGAITSELPSPLPAHITLRNKFVGTDMLITRAVWSPDGQTLAFTIGSHAIHILDVENNQISKGSLQMPAEVRCFAWSPDSLSIAAGLSNNQVWIGHVGMNDSPTLISLEAVINDVLWSPDQRWLAAALEDGIIQIRDTRIWREGSSLPESDRFPRCIAWSPPGAFYLVAGYTNGYVIAWDTKTWSKRRNYEGHTAAVNSVAISPSRAFFASGSDDGTVRVWRIDETDESYQFVLKDHSGPVTRVCFSSNGRLLASKSNDGTIRLWHHPDWKCVAVIDASAAVSGQPPLPSTVLAFHPSEPLLAACIESDKTISTLEIDLQTLLNTATQPEVKKAEQTRIFISYSRGDEPNEQLVQQVIQALSEQHKVFTARDIVIGEDWTRRIENEIRESDYLIVFLSAQSAQSRYIADEIQWAYERAQQQDGRPKILPVRVAYREPFPHELGSYLNHIQWAYWDTPSDTPRLIEELKQAISGADLPANVQPNDKPRTRIFFAYKRNVEPDESTTRQIAEALSEHHDVFIDHKMPIGIEWAPAIIKAFGNADVLIVLLTPGSMRSEAVRSYLHRAFERSEASGGTLKIIPVRLAYYDPLPEDIVYLDRLPQIVWQEAADTPRVIDEIQQMLSSQHETPEPVAEQPAVEQDKSPTGNYVEITITTQSDSGLRFVVDTATTAREDLLLPTQRRLVDELIRQATLSTSFDEKLATSLFELLIPHSLKSRLTEGRGIILTLDQQTARYPWEILAERTDDGTHPLAVRQEMNRRLSIQVRPLAISPSYDRDALIIGEPKNELVELPGARKEANDVEGYLMSGGLDTKLLLEPDARTVISELFSRRNRIIHIAGQGINNPEDRAQSGIPLSDGMFLTGAEFAQMRLAPELVFLNCCYLGQIDTPVLSSSGGLPLFAASMVEQLIGIGVKAIIVPGWAVDDVAAYKFATTFYKHLSIDGLSFGEAALRARRAIYEQYPNTNTWGAYQCYGDPNFRLQPPTTTAA